MKLVFATHNKHKFLEIREMFLEAGIQISDNTQSSEANKTTIREIQLLDLDEIGCVEDIPENKATIEENASEKSWYIFNGFGYNTFADDTGLEIDALKGEPGVYSARYAGEQKDPDDNMNLVLRKLKGKSNRKAQFKTVISLILNGNETRFEGIVKGTILEERRGEKGFGYDPIFLPEGYDKTFAEMDLYEKNRISHRSTALRKLINYLLRM
jgi:XTP/dITP diphosphohydrolase